MKRLSQPVSIAAILASIFFAASARAGEFTVPVDWDNSCRLPLVKVQVKGKEATFLLDTGATKTVIDNDLLGVPGTWSEKARLRAGVPGLQGLGALTLIRKLRIGGYTVKYIQVRVLDLQPISDNCKTDLSGVLGNDVLRRFDDVTIDFKNKQLKMRE